MEKIIFLIEDSCGEKEKSHQRKLEREKKSKVVKKNFWKKQNQKELYKMMFVVFEGLLKKKKIVCLQNIAHLISLSY